MSGALENHRRPNAIKKIAPEMLSGALNQPALTVGSSALAPAAEVIRSRLILQTMNESYTAV